MIERTPEQRAKRQWRRRILIRDFKLHLRPRLRPGLDKEMLRPSPLGEALPLSATLVWNGLRRRSWPSLRLGVSGALRSVFRRPGVPEREREEYAELALEHAAEELIDAWLDHLRRDIERRGCLDLRLLADDMFFPVPSRPSPDPDPFEMAVAPHPLTRELALEAFRAWHEALKFDFGVPPTALGVTIDPIVALRWCKLPREAVSFFTAVGATVVY